MPKIPPNTRTVPLEARTARTVAIGVSIPLDVLPELDIMSENEGRSRSSMITYLVVQALNQRRYLPTKYIPAKAGRGQSR